MLAGVYVNTAANAVSKNSPKFSMVFFIPCVPRLIYLVLEIRRSAHCTITIVTN